MKWNHLIKLFGPSSIFWPPYILCSLILALYWLRKNEGLNWKEGLKFHCSSKIWTSSSCQLDIVLAFVNLVLLGSALEAFGKNCFQTVLRMRFEIVSMHTITWIEGLMATVVTMISIDFASYWTHRAMHIQKWLWRIHSVHHSAEVLTPLTTYRQHPFEFFFLNGCRSLAAGLGLLLLRAFFPDGAPAWTVGGIGAGFFIYMFTVNLHHSMVPFRYWKRLRKILISPHIHHLHHSSNAKHVGFNYGVVFAFWDNLFGTYFDYEPGFGELSFGIPLVERAQLPTARFAFFFIFRRLALRLRGFCRSFRPNSSQ